MQELPMIPDADMKTFDTYEAKFKALADAKRLRIMNVLVQHGKVNVNDLAEMVNMPQSKLSYHLKILLDQDLIEMENQGKWNYYMLNSKEVNHILSYELCCLFRFTEPNCC